MMEYDRSIKVLHSSLIRCSESSSDHEKTIKLITALKKFLLKASTKQKIKIILCLIFNSKEILDQNNEFEKYYSEEFIEHYSPLINALPIKISFSVLTSVINHFILDYELLTCLPNLPTKIVQVLWTEKVIENLVNADQISLTIASVVTARTHHHHPLIKLSSIKSVIQKEENKTTTLHHSLLYILLLLKTCTIIRKKVLNVCDKKLEMEDESELFYRGKGGMGVGDDKVHEDEFDCIKALLDQFTDIMKNLSVDKWMEAVEIDVLKEKDHPYIRFWTRDKDHEFPSNLQSLISQLAFDVKLGLDDLSGFIIPQTTQIMLRQIAREYDRIQELGLDEMTLNDVINIVKESPINHWKYYASLNYLFSEKLKESCENEDAINLFKNLNACEFNPNICEFIFKLILEKQELDLKMDDGKLKELFFLTVHNQPLMDKINYLSLILEKGSIEILKLEDFDDKIQEFLNRLTTFISKEEKEKSQILFHHEILTLAIQSPLLFMKMIINQVDTTCETIPIVIEIISILNCVSFYKDDQEDPYYLVELMREKFFSSSSSTSCKELKNIKSLLVEFSVSLDFSLSQYFLSDLFKSVFDFIKRMTTTTTTKEDLNRSLIYIEYAHDIIIRNNEFLDKPVFIALCFVFYELSQRPYNIITANINEYILDILSLTPPSTFIEKNQILNCYLRYYLNGRRSKEDKNDDINFIRSQFYKNPLPLKNTVQEKEEESTSSERICNVVQLTAILHYLLPKEWNIMRTSYSNNIADYILAVNYHVSSNKLGIEELQYMLLQLNRETYNYIESTNNINELIKVHAHVIDLLKNTLSKDLASTYENCQIKLFTKIIKLMEREKITHNMHLLRQLIHHLFLLENHHHHQSKIICEKKLKSFLDDFL